MSTLLDKLGEAIKSAEAHRAKYTACPKCKKQLAMLSLSFLNYRVAYLCRFCEHTEPEYVTGTEAKK